LELSLREALRLQHQTIGPAHVLLGLLREGQGIACQVLLVLGGDLRELQRAVETIAAESTEPDVPPVPLGVVSLGAARGVLQAVEDAFGGDAEIAFLRIRRTGRVQVVVRRVGADDLDVVIVVDRGDRWEVEG
jgi:hypothetical protein